MPATAPTQADPPLDQAPGSSGETSLKLAKGVSLTFEDDSLIVKGMPCNASLAGPNLELQLKLV